MSKEFSLGAILSIVFGRRLLPCTSEEPSGKVLPAEILDLTEYMLGERFKSHGLETRDKCRESLAIQFPQLHTKEAREAYTTLDTFLSEEMDPEKREAFTGQWLADQVIKYGERLTVAPIYN